MHNVFKGTEDGTLVPTWHMLMGYPNLISRMPTEIRETLDALQELVPIRFYRCRLDTYLTWYREGRELGLITIEDHLKISCEMASGAGGM